jgi:uncharacterized membrane protein
MRLLEWYLGVPPAGAGQASHWGLRTELLVPGGLPGWALALLAILGTAAAIAISLRDTRAMRWTRRAPVMLLRLASLTVAVLMLARLSLTLTRTGLPTLALLIDVSASMGVEDRYQEQAAAAARRLGGRTPNGISRLDLVRGLLTTEDGRYLARLGAAHRLAVYTFAEDAQPVGVTVDPSAAAQRAELLADIRQLQPEGQATRPASAVQQVLDDLRGDPPAALLILTDGIATTGDDERLVMAADAARSRAVPLMTIGFGSSQPAQDVELAEVLGDELVFVDDPLTLTFTLKGFGMAGRRVRVALREEGKSQVLEATEITLAEDGQPASGELTHTMSSEGEFELVLEAEALPGDSFSGNNRARHRVSVRRASLEVLLVDDLPRWEFRHLKTLLERDPAIRLRTVLQSADLDFAAEDRTALSRFPVRAGDLQEFDVVILGDVDLPYLSPHAAADLRQFVAVHGGGLILIAGERHQPPQAVGTPLEDLLPIVPPVLVDASAAPVAPRDTPLQPRLTVEGRTRGALRLGSSSSQNEDVWSRLSPLYWACGPVELKAGAQVLVEAVPPSGNGARGLPLIVYHRFGAGQVQFHASDELWRWRERVEDQYYGRYWLQTIRYLSRMRNRADRAGLELTTDRSVYQLGEEVEVRLRFLDGSLLPTPPTLPEVTVEGGDGVDRTVSLASVPGDSASFLARLPRLAPGNYLVRLNPAGSASPVPAKGQPAATPLPTATFRVELAASELRERNYRASELREAARLTGGTHYEFWNAQAAPGELPAGRVVPVSSELVLPVWNRWESLVLLVGLLATEWICRKRLGLI